MHSATGAHAGQAIHPAHRRSSNADPRDTPPVQSPIQGATPDKPTDEAALPHWTHPGLTRDPHHQAIERLINRRLSRLAARHASNDGPPPGLHHARAAATAMVDLFVLFDWPGQLCLSLAQDRLLWADLLQSPGTPLFRRRGAADGPPGDLRLRRPLDRPVLASVIGALLERDRFAEARQLLHACDSALDQRVVLKWLLRRPGEPLKRLASHDAARDFEQVLKDMLNNHPDKYGPLQPAIEALLAHWHPPEPPDERADTRQALAERACPIDGERPIEQSLQQMTPEQRLSLAGFVRQRLTVLLADDDALPLIETLVFLCACLMNPALCGDAEAGRVSRAFMGDAELERAAERAAQRHGLIGAWLLTQDLSPKNSARLIVGPLMNGANGIKTPQATNRYVQGVMRFLSGLRPADGSQDSEALRQARQLARNHLLPAMVAAFARLLRLSADAHAEEWTAVAQWAWVTDATLGLLRDNAQALSFGATMTLYAPCLRLVAKHNPALRDGLKLLFTRQSLKVHPALKDTAGVVVQELFALCRPDTRLGVLRVPLPRLWLSLPPVLDVGRFFADNPLSLEEQASQLGHLAPRVGNGFDLTNLSELQVRLLDATNIHEVIETLSQAPDARRWAITLFDGFRSRLGDSTVVIRPRGLPALLMWLQRITLALPAQGNSEVWHGWVHFICQCARRKKESKDPLSPSDWLSLGAWLPLGPAAAVAQARLATLSKAPTLSEALPYLLLGWLRQRFAERASPASGGQAAPKLATPLFLAVLAQAKALIKRLPEEERTDLRNELKTLGIRYADTKKQ